MVKKFVLLLLLTAIKRCWTCWPRSKIEMKQLSAFSQNTIGRSDANTSEALLITGGYNKAEQSVEVFLPWLNTTCELPPLPNQRFAHVQSGNTLCGGGYNSSTDRSCLQWSVQQGGWITLPFTLNERRWASSAWTVSQDSSLIIMGGDGLANRNTETVPSDGDITKRTFRMKYWSR